MENHEVNYTAFGLRI